ncbi:universal stress protein [Streptomyces triculaminicus]|uniref:Universal stress protein n=2 Tax=Streptomyces TaxID=1883 RepID=A0A939FTN8_9ACTN|nr:MULTISPECIES: universal stress protein [Streptomyces]MBO0655792.1 universal stress protein [Streptomyces triculaminicus]QSY49813.1 universal stress protein [Streptomyces griseocarneus]
MSGTITAGVDGTDHSLAAAVWAAAEARRRGAALRLVHAWTWHPLDLPIEADAGTQERWAHDLLRAAESRVTAAEPGLPVSAHVLPDDAVPALVAETRRTGLLVLGSRGHGALVGYLVGSVALHVLRQAESPVVLVRDPGEAGEGPASDEVVVGVDDVTEEGDRVLEFAFEAAQARGARLRAVRAWSLPPVFARSPGSLRLADEAGGLEPLEKRRLAEALRPWRQVYPDVTVAEHVEMGSGAEVLLSTGGRAGLLVVGRRTARRRVGHVTHAVLHHASCPVAVVPHP